MKTLLGVIDHLTLSPLCPWLLNGPRQPTLFALLSSLNPQRRTKPYAGYGHIDVRSTDTLLRASPLSIHKTSTIALVPHKPTSHALPELSSASSIKKRKKKEDPAIATETDPDACFERSVKKPKLGSHEGGDTCSTPVTRHKAGKKKKTKGDQDPTPEAVRTKETSEEKRVGKDKKRKNKAPEPTVSEEDEDEAGGVVRQEPSSSESEENDEEYAPPVHESLTKAPRSDAPSSSKKSKKYAPPDETPDQRDSRTVFVGNVSSQVMTSKVSWRMHSPT